MFALLSFMFLLLHISICTDSTDAIHVLIAGVETAKTLGWLLEMCISDAATFFQCVTTGIMLIIIVDLTLIHVFHCVYMNAAFIYIYFLQLPPPQLESAMGKHPNLKISLANFASQPSVKASLPRYIFVHLVRTYYSTQFYCFFISAYWVKRVILYFVGLLRILYSLYGRVNQIDYYSVKIVLLHPVVFRMLCYLYQEACWIILKYIF